VEDSPGEGRLQKGHEVRASLVDLKDFRIPGQKRFAICVFWVRADSNHRRN